MPQDQITISNLDYTEELDQSFLKDPLQVHDLVEEKTILRLQYAGF